VTRYTSALTLQVLGNAKGVFTTALSIFIFRNPFTVTSVGGYLITVAVGSSKHHAVAAATSYLAHALRDLPARSVTKCCMVCRAWAAMQRPSGIRLHRRPASPAHEIDTTLFACPDVLYGSDCQSLTSGDACEAARKPA
jgi:hypothetical protein